ncbi:hypothetical protein IDJ77_22015 [Mucilaginibacter sp. ZT4R22]|uniref:Lipoprotein n=1 Tax=Mucilaginibacter pankratovii TaxID=2772110 RepID=A0ABR7WW43_9SPHI|nr:hypothetical protein [Mucilaginibacter pankratovii]MBD1366506.1 hypothetical protein [Mucilaginibacter pankratovii]
MKNLNHLLLLAITLCVLSSCTTRYYAPGLYQNDVQFMIKPHSKDSVKTRVYASGAYLAQSGAGGQGSSNSGVLNIYQSRTIPHFNFSYGVMGYTGVYTQTQTTTTGTATNNLFINKSFSGYGFNGSTSFYLSTKKTDFRLIGVDLSYTHEGGDFLAFRKAQVGQPNVQSAAQPQLFTYGIFSEFIVKANETTNFGFKLFANHTPGKINRDLRPTGSSFNTNNSSTSGFTSFVGYKHFNFHTTFAIGSVYGYTAGSSQLGLAYKF